MLKGKDIFDEMNRLGSERIPFIFIIDFLKENGMVIPLDELNDEIQYQIVGENHSFDSEIDLKKFPIPMTEYAKQFNSAQETFNSKEVDMINLTCETPIEINLNLEEIFHYSHSKYKLLWKDRFVCFSPETFVKIQEGRIFTYPMKGTIDAAIENAEELILSNEKEIEEHQITIDLVEDELKKVAHNVSTTRFRFIDKLETNDKALLQVSSEVSGELSDDYHSHLGDLFDLLLPAGSICGSPKEQALELIQDVETHSRDFYTGIFGVYDGKNLDSSILIRFIEQKENTLVFKSGGGITAQSKLEDEYNEMIDKIYVPIN